MRYKYLVGCLAGLLAAVSFAQPPFPPRPPRLPAEIPAEEVAAARQVAAEALTVVDALSGDRIAINLGFAGIEEIVIGATLGDPMPLYYVNLNALKDHDPSDGATPLITSAHELIFPIRFGQEVRSSVSVKKQDDVWKMTTIGQSHLVRSLIKLQEEVDRDELIRVLWVPAIYQMFLAVGEPPRVHLMPVYDHVPLGLNAGELILDRHLLEKLVGYARTVQGALVTDD